MMSGGDDGRYVVQPTSDTYTPIAHLRQPWYSVSIMLRWVLDQLFPVYFGVIGQHPRYGYWRILGPIRGQEDALELASELNEEVMLSGQDWYYSVIRWESIPPEKREKL